MSVNIFVPKKQNLIYEKKIHSKIKKIIHQGNYILGSEVKKLEKKFIKYFKTKKAIGVKNGTDAIILSLKALNITKGDEVITTSHTALATIASIISVGATPVIADIEDNLYTINPIEIKKKISKKTKAIIPVHIYGQSCAIKSIIKIAKKKKIYVIEDCSQSIGAEYNKKKLGTFGDIGTFSFYPTKNLGAIGDGGMIITKNKSIGKRIAQLREYGWDIKRNTSEPGINSRLDELQAGILNIKFSDLDKTNYKRNEIANFYLNNLKSKHIKLPVVRKNSKHVFHIFAILVKKRKKFIKYLARKKIYVGIHYKIPACKNFGYGKLCKYSDKEIYITKKVSRSTVSLPVYPELKKNEIIKVVRAINSYK